MNANARVVPILSTPELEAVRRFWVDLLGFSLTFDAPTYLGLRAPGDSGSELGFMPPEPGEPAFDGRGVTLGVEVPDVDEWHARLSAEPVEVTRALQDNPWGDRSFSA